MIKVDMSFYTPPPPSILDILYVDDSLIIVSKPAGLLAVPGRGDDKKDCLVSRVQSVYPAALVVHRLDMATSGLMVLALNKVIHRNLSILFQERQVEKRYTAWIQGQLIEDTGKVDLPLIADWPNRPLQKVDLSNGKPSLTHWKTLKRERDRTLVSLFPLTGRTHQLRVHMKAIGHPILGDALYAPKNVQEKAPRLLLHAEYIGFSHPLSGEQLSVIQPPPF